MVPLGIARVTVHEDNLRLKRKGGKHPAEPNKAAPGNTGNAGRRQRDVRPTPGGCASTLARGPSFGRNPRGSPDFLVYPVPKAYRGRCLGT